MPPMMSVFKYDICTASYIVQKSKNWRVPEVEREIGEG
jgi:hypothetical protein